MKGENNALAQWAAKTNVVTALILKGENNCGWVLLPALVVVTALILKGENNQNRYQFLG